MKYPNMDCKLHRLNAELSVSFFCFCLFTNVKAAKNSQSLEGVLKHHSHILWEYLH